MRITMTPDHDNVTLLVFITNIITSYSLIKCMTSVRQRAGGEDEHHFLLENGEPDKKKDNL